MDSMRSWVMDLSTVAGVRERRRVSSRFAACVLLCSLVAALRRIEKPLLSTCCDAAALLCLAPLPPYLYIYIYIYIYTYIYLYIYIYI